MTTSRELTDLTLPAAPGLPLPEHLTARRDRLARAVRVISVPPLMAAGLLLLLLFRGSISAAEALIGAGGIVLLPSLAYAFSKDRERQRRLAFVFSGIGYAASCGAVLLTDASPAARCIFTTYLLSVIFLIIFNKALHIKASGHACSITGPIVAAAVLFGGWLVWPCLILWALIFWSSVRLKRHTVAEFLLGAACSSTALLIDLLIFRLP